MEPPALSIPSPTEYPAPLTGSPRAYWAIGMARLSPKTVPSGWRSIFVRPNMDRHPEGTVFGDNLAIPIAQYALGEPVSGAGYSVGLGILNAGGSIPRPPGAFVFHGPRRTGRHSPPEIEFHDVERQIDSSAESA